MTKEVTKYEPGPETDDGFSGSRSGRISKGSYLRWNDTQHWLDRDGLAPPSPLLVVAINETVRRWKDGRAEDICDKPLPDPEQLNSAIAVAEWERGIDGNPRPPWAHTVHVYLVSLATGEAYTYSHSTVGAHVAWDHLREAVITMRMLRGTQCMPLVNLSERPMKMKYGMGKRPHFEIVGWKTPGDDGKAIAAKPTPQLSGPVAASAPAAPTAPSATSIATSPAKSKPPVNLTDSTLAAMGDVKPASVSEELNDEIPW
jgi:hypothetical protein